MERYFPVVHQCDEDSSQHLWGACLAALEVELEGIADGANSYDVVRREGGSSCCPACCIGLHDVVSWAKPSSSAESENVQLVTGQSWSWCATCALNKLLWVSDSQEGVSQDDTKRRVAKAHQLVQMGKSHLPRRVWKGRLLPGHEGNPSEGSSCRIVRVTTGHLGSTFASPSDTHLLLRAAGLLARPQVPNTIIDIIRVVRLAALSKPDGGVTRICASGDGATPARSLDASRM